MKFFLPVIAVILVFSFSTCEMDFTNNNPVTPDTPTNTGKVTFINLSSYPVIVYRDNFSGPELLNSPLPANFGQITVDVLASEHFGISTFAIEYLSKISGDFDSASGDVYANMIDPEIQLTGTVEVNKTIQIIIPQPDPVKLEIRSAFIKIFNAHNASREIEFNHLGTTFTQAGNGYILIPHGGTGVYKFTNIPAAGRLFQNYRVEVNALSTPAYIEDFLVENGYIYNFIYDGTTVTSEGKQSIAF